MKRNYKRRTYFIKNSAQGRFIRRFLLISFLGGVGALAAFNYLSYKKIDATLYSMTLPHLSPGGLLWHEMLYTNLFVVVFTVIIFAITARGLYIRVNGPLKKMASETNKAAAGDLAREITLRSNDEFQDFALELNQAIAHLRRQFQDIRDINQEISRLSTSPAAEEDGKKRLSDLKEAIAKLDNILSSCKI